MILQKLYDLSDPQMEEMLYDRLSFRRFCCLGLEDRIPDETTILRFRNLLQGHSKKLLALVNQDLGEKGIEWAGGRIVDATLIKSKAKPPRGGELDPHLKALNKIHSRIRSAGERTFAHLKDIFGLRSARYKGWDKNQVHLDLLAIAYNLKRSIRMIPG